MLSGLVPSGSFQTVELIFKKVTVGVGLGQRLSLVARLTPFPEYEYQFARAAVTKHHSLGGINNRNVLFPSGTSQTRSPRSRCQQSLFLGL